MTDYPCCKSIYNITELFDVVTLTTWESDTVVEADFVMTSDMSSEQWSSSGVSDWVRWHTTHWCQPRRGCRGHIPPIFWLGDVNGNIPPNIITYFRIYWLPSVRSASSRFYSAIRRRQFASVRQADSHRLQPWTRVDSRAFQFAIRFDSLCESIRFVKNRPFDSLVAMQFLH